MSDELPMCVCDEFYDDHHPECPVRRTIETLQDRVAELEDACANWLDRELKAIERGNRLDAALAQIEKDEVLPEPIRKFAGRARGGAVEIEKSALQANAWTLAVYIVEGGTLERDRSSCRATHDRLYCDSCGCYEDDKGYIDHLPDCVVTVARKVLEPKPRTTIDEINDRFGDGE